MVAASEQATVSVPEKIEIHFPDHPVFAKLPAHLISFDDFLPGALVPGDGKSGPEVDDEGLPTLNLPVEHSITREKPGRLKVDASVTRLSKDDAWKLGKGDLLPERWVEPAKTLWGEFGTDKTPFHRADRAFTQFLTSRSCAQVKLVHALIFRTFRCITRLAPSTPEPHIKSADLGPDGIAPADETCLFVADMHGTMKEYWKMIMETAGEDFNVFSASQVFEITNAYLHYLLHYEVLPEAYLASSLARSIALGARTMPQMFLVEAFLRETIQPGGWNALCHSAWVQVVDDTWEDGGMRERALREVGITEEEAQARGMQGAEDGLGNEDEDEVEAGNADDWLGGEVPGEEYQNFSLAPPKTADALAILETQLAPTPPSAFGVLRRMEATAVDIASTRIVTESFPAPFACLAGKMAFQLHIPVSTDQVCTLYLDISPTIQRHAHGMQRILNAAGRLSITADWTEIGEATPRNVSGKIPTRWWIATNVTRGSSADLA